MCRNLWVKGFSHQWRFSQCLCQHKGLGRCQQECATCLLMDLPFFPYQVLYLKGSTWYAKAFCVIPKNSFYTQIAREINNPKKQDEFPCLSLWLVGRFWFSLLFTWYIFECPILGHIGDYFSLLQPNLHWPGLALHLSRTSHSEKKSSLLRLKYFFRGSGNLSSLFSFWLLIIFTSSWQKTHIKIIPLLRELTYPT